MKLNEIEIKLDNLFYTLEQGANRLRIVSEFAVHNKVFPGKSEPVVRYSVWIIDRKDGKIKMAEFGKSITKQLQEYSVNPEYAFDVVPNYDITINRKGTGQFDTEYTVIPDRKDTPLTEVESIKVQELESPSDFLKKGTKEEMLTTDSIPF